MMQRSAKGFYNEYLDVDLTTGTIETYDIPQDWIELHVGGKGIGARILLQELAGREDPLGADNIVVFATGPFQGTGIVGSGRHLVMAISPKSGAVAESYVGGYFGDELGRSGFDGIIIRGVSSTPTYLVVQDGTAELKDATDLWGLGTGETEELLRIRHPQARVTSIGPAGENCVYMACLISDRSRSAGRPGFGAVFGSKRLKAVVVRRGPEKAFASSRLLAKQRRIYAQGFLNDDGMKLFGEYGTARAVMRLVEEGGLPTKNFQMGIFDGADKISAEALHDCILVGRETCAGCPIRCKRVVAAEYHGVSIRPEFGGPEYETLAAFGSLCLNSDLNCIALANQLCNDYGIDTISAGVSIAFLMEASEGGLLDPPVKWGDGEAIVELVHEIARKEALGGRLAQGVDRLAEELGVSFQMTIKGHEIPMHDPRTKKGLGITYATSPRGATHMEGIHDPLLERDSPTPELGVTDSYDRFSLSDKPHPVVIYENLRSFSNSLILCVLTTPMTGPGYRYPQIRELLGHATGISLTPGAMLEIGARNHALMRIHAARAGYTHELDGLPKRFSDPLPEGNSQGQRIDANEMRTAIEKYYRIRGDDRIGPTDETLRRLSLEDLVRSIEISADCKRKGGQE